MRKLLIAIFLLAGSASQAASTWYVNQAGSGSQNGTSIGNAWSAAAFNTLGNWSATAGSGTQISPGDTVMLEGNITTALTFQRGGTDTSHYITLLFDTGASMTTAVWASTGAIIAHSKNYIVIDGGGAPGMGGNGTGGVKPDITKANGVISNTNNGSALGNQLNSVGVSISDSSYITVQNLLVANLYVHTRFSIDDESLSYGTDDCVQANNNTGNTSNVTVTNCIFHDAPTAFYVAYRGTCHTHVYSNCWTYNCNWGAGVGDPNVNCSLDSFDMHGNTYGNPSNWDDSGVSSATVGR